MCVFLVTCVQDILFIVVVHKALHRCVGSLLAATNIIKFSVMIISYVMQTCTLQQSIANQQSIVNSL